MKFPQETVCLFSSPDVIVSQDQPKSLSLAACLACECTIHSSAGSLSFSQDPKCLFLSSGGQHCFLIPCRNTAGLQESLFFQKQKKKWGLSHTHIFLWWPKKGGARRLDQDPEIDALLLFLLPDLLWESCTVLKSKGGKTNNKSSPPKHAWMKVSRCDGIS